MADHELTLPASGPRVSGMARKLGLAGFWRWWTGELGALAPGSARTALARRRMRPTVVFEGGVASLWLPTTVDGHPAMRQEAAIPLAGDAASVAAAGRAALAKVPTTYAAAPGGATRLVVALAPRDVLRKRLRLPAAVAENLHQALAYDLDRHTPFKPEELYFDAMVVGRDPAKNEIEVDLASARRSVVDAACTQVQSWGAEVVAVIPDAPAKAAVSPLNLLPHASRSQRPLWTRWEFWVPLAVLAMLALAAVALPLWQKRQLAIALLDVAEKGRQQAAVSEALRQDLDTRVADYNFVLGRKYAYPSASVQLDEASRLLPDDTWLTQLDLKATSKGKEMQREILIRGETANAGRLVPIFEESKIFTQASPRSPTSKIQPGPGEIFDLGAQVRPLPLPATVPLLTVAGSAPAEAPKPEAAAAPKQAAAGNPATAAPKSEAAAPPPGPAPTTAQTPPLAPTAATPPAPVAAKP
jgi:general secretion pathway protein L